VAAYGYDEFFRNIYETIEKLLVSATGDWEKLTAYKGVDYTFKLSNKRKKDSDVTSFKFPVPSFINHLFIKVRVRCFPEAYSTYRPKLEDNKYGSYSTYGGIKRKKIDTVGLELGLVAIDKKIDWPLYLQVMHHELNLCYEEYQSQVQKNSTPLSKRTSHYEKLSQWIRIAKTPEKEFLYLLYKILTPSQLNAAIASVYGEMKGMKSTVMEDFQKTQAFKALYMESSKWLETVVHADRNDVINKFIPDFKYMGDSFRQDITNPDTFTAYFSKLIEMKRKKLIDGIVRSAEMAVMDNRSQDETPIRENEFPMINRNPVYNPKPLSSTVAESYGYHAIKLNENRQSKNLSNARHYLVGIGYTPEKAQDTLDAMRSDIPNSRVCRCKFMTGLCRMFVEGELKDYETISDLNQTLKLIIAHENEYDSNLNGMKAADLINRFATAVQGDVQKDRESLASQQFDGTEDGDYNGYTILPINDFEEASQYSKYTKWCVTREKDSYDNYTKKGRIKFYFLLKAGFEAMKKPPESGNPLDEYGLSMVAVSVNMDGSLSTCTSRWNHDNGGNDAAMDTAQISRLVGRNFYDVFLPFSKEEIERNLDRFRYFKPERLQKYLDEFYHAFFTDLGGIKTSDGLDMFVGNAHTKNARYYPVSIGDRINYLDKLVVDTKNHTVTDLHVIFPQFEDGFDTDLLISDISSSIWYNKINGTFKLFYDGKKNIGRMDGTLVFPEWLGAKDRIVILTNGFTLFNKQGVNPVNDKYGSSNLLDIDLKPVFKGITAYLFDYKNDYDSAYNEGNDSIVFYFHDREGEPFKIVFHLKDSTFSIPNTKKSIPYTEINSYLASKTRQFENTAEQNIMKVENRKKPNVFSIMESGEKDFDTNIEKELKSARFEKAVRKLVAQAFVDYAKLQYDNRNFLKNNL
jgi:hypothetical protein